MADKSVKVKVTITTVGVLVAALVLPLGGAASGGSSQQCPTLPQGADPVHLHPADFSANINNHQWPMTVGSRWVYRVLDYSNGSVKHDVIKATNHTKMIADGIRAR